MEPEEPKTESFDVAQSSNVDEPSDVAQPRGPHYFGVAPRGLAAVLAAFAFGAGIVFLVAGNAAVGVVLLVAAVLLAALWAEQARRHRELSTVDRVTASAVDHTR